jgi:hypothetical protein
MRRFRAEDHRRCQAPLVSEPVVGFFLQLCNRVSCKKLRRDALFHSLVCDRLGASLTKFCKAAVTVGARPRAALAVEAILLVKLQERSRCLDGTHLAEGMLYGLNDTHDAGGFLAGMADLCGIRVDWWLGAAMRSVRVWNLLTHNGIISSPRSALSDRRMR